eukprot:SAG11_NODE_13324_length_660_cov_0.827094_2_plen_143_part_01
MLLRAWVLLAIAGICRSERCPAMCASSTNTRTTHPAGWRCAPKDGGSTGANHSGYPPHVRSHRESCQGCSNCARNTPLAWVLGCAASVSAPPQARLPSPAVTLMAGARPIRRSVGSGLPDKPQDLAPFDLGDTRRSGFAAVKS